MNQATSDFIREHAEADVRQLALLGNRNPEVDLPFALQQIAGRQKARTKLPTWATMEGIVYPPSLPMEQCSSELTARYKARLAASRIGADSVLIDLTGGFGVDFSWMARSFSRAVYVERQSELCAISSQNFRLLSLPAEVVQADAADYLHRLTHADMVFLDPARRDEHGARTYGIADCTPNVLELLDELMTKADRMMLKLSPMLDWRKAVDDIQRSATAFVSEVHIVSVANECKELLLEVISDKRKLADAAPVQRVVCANLLTDGTEEHFEFDMHTPVSVPAIHYSLSTIHYLFVPNASVMKAGCFELLQQQFGVAQLAPNSHLFVSHAEQPLFPGRQFRIERSTSMNKRSLKAALQDIDRANIAVRNFPLSAADLRKRLKLKDGGDVYIFATTVQNEGHQLLICRK